MTYRFPFFESIRLKDGVFGLLPLHQARMQRTQAAHFALQAPIGLETFLQGQAFPRQGLFKCRIAYGLALDRPEFIPYHKKDIRSLRLIDAGDLDYRFKSNDRSAIDALLAQKQDCDDVLMVKNGLITDSSYCNIVFYSNQGWFTPDMPLLPGVQREQLLRNYRIRPRRIRPEDLTNYLSYKLINAMMPFDEADIHDVSCIKTS